MRRDSKRSQDRLKGLALLLLICLTLSSVACMRMKVPLRESNVITLQGERLRDGNCRFNSDLRLSRGEKVSEERILDWDQSTCSFRVERGKPWR